MDVVRVLLADDHPMFRYGLRSVLAAEPRTELVGEASTGDEAVALADELRPDVVLMDLNMPGLHGTEATRRIVERHPGIRVLVVTMFDDSASVLTALRAGARGYLVKGADREELLRAVFEAAAGGSVLSGAAVEHVARHLSAPTAAKGPGPFGLTEREQAILALMVAGYTNPAISQRLELSPKTVRNYVSSILAKLGAGSRAEAIARAREAGF